MSMVISNTSFSTRYKPRTLHEVVFPDAYVEQEIMAYVDDTLLIRPLLLYGNYGSGKTTVAKLLPHAKIPGYHEASDCEFICAAARRNVNEITKAIENHMGKVCFNELNMPVVIIDEIDNLKNDVQASLKSFIDAFMDHGFFIFTTNHFSKVDPGIVSRSNDLSFNTFDPARWLPRLKRIIAKEMAKMPVDDELINMAKFGKGDMRKTMGLLQTYCRQNRIKSPGRPPKPKFTVLQGG